MAKNVSRLCPVPLEGKVTWLITTLEMCFLLVSGSQLSALEARRGAQAAALPVGPLLLERPSLAALFLEEALQTVSMLWSF